ncbi:transcriptional adapter 3 isoform X1 [Cimex lectularius]|uniref:Transcriptional adapter 3 n=1 Tax=Cimex lectularius TaxID=79782 RepID=A0A8I6RC53_CIMLE|nr:transcriptional adapter 3 isoform X1 [Cimex lectularius]
MKPKSVSKKDGPGKHGREVYPNGKQKEGRSQSCESQEASLFNFPYLKSVDKSRDLHCFTMILNRNKEDAVGMKDLDRLQSELEQMLSAAALRLRVLHNELNNFSATEGNRNETSVIINNNKKRKLNDGQVGKSMKEMVKVREKEATTKMESSSSENEIDNSSDVLCEKKKEKKKKINNELSNKFWASVEPYVGDITEENIEDLEELIQSCDNDMMIKIPPLGLHYTSRWADEDLSEEKQSSAIRQTKNSPSSESDSISLIKRASSLCSDRTPGPFVQRLVSALMDEPSHNSFNSKLGDENDSTLFLGKLPLYHTSSCFERRIRRELEVVGLLDNNDNSEDTDEILTEIRKCHEELKTVAIQNKEHLTRLVEEAKQEMKKQEIKKKIKALDTQLIEIYRKITAAKLKNKKTLQDKEREQAWKTLKSREMLLKALEEV